jgi:hypothetical protein
MLYPGMPTLGWVKAGEKKSKGGTKVTFSKNILLNQRGSDE